jgi:hypothetical protein
MASIDIDVDDFLSNLSKREIDEVIECLVNDGHLTKDNIKSSTPNASILEQIYQEKINALRNNRLNLTLVEEEIITTIAKRFI